MLSETLRLAAAERFRLPQLPKGKHTHKVWHIGVRPHWLFDWSFLIFVSLSSSSCFPIFSPHFTFFPNPLFLRYVRTMVLIWTPVQRGRCWVCWWTPTVVSTCTSTAWTRAWRHRTSLRPATPSSTSTASVSRSVSVGQFHVLLEQNPVLSEVQLSLQPSTGRSKVRVDWLINCQVYKMSEKKAQQIF